MIFARLFLFLFAIQYSCILMSDDSLISKNGIGAYLCQDMGDIDCCDALTFAVNNIGFYGSGWADWLSKNSDDYNLLIYQYNNNKSALAAKDLSKLDKSKIRIVARIRVWESKYLAKKADSRAVAKYKNIAIDKAIRSVRDLVAQGVGEGSIDEENIPFAGREVLLNEIYMAIKSEFPSFRVYQWYSPNKKIMVPGEAWPNLLADGWIIDEYLLDSTDYERLLLRYIGLNKPLISVLWASPTWILRGKYGVEYQGVDSIRKWKADLSAEFYRKLAINIKYRIPTVYFSFDKIGESVRPLHRVDNFQYFLPTSTQLLESCRIQ